MPFDQWSKNILTMFFTIACSADFYELYFKKLQLTAKVHSNIEKKLSYAHSDINTTNPCTICMIKSALYMEYETPLYIYVDGRTKFHAGLLSTLATYRNIDKNITNILIFFERWHILSITSERCFDESYLIIILKRLKTTLSLLLRKTDANYKMPLSDPAINWVRVPIVPYVPYVSHHYHTQFFFRERRQPIIDRRIDINGEFSHVNSWENDIHPCMHAAFY